MPNSIRMPAAKSWQHNALQRDLDHEVRPRIRPEDAGEGKVDVLLPAKCVTCGRLIHSVADNAGPESLGALFRL